MAIEPGRAGRPKGKSVGKWLAEIGEATDTNGLPKNQMIAKRLIAAALDTRTDIKTLLDIAKFMTERIDGKPVQPNVNMEVVNSPFADIPTIEIEAVIKRIEQEKKDKSNG